MRYDIRTFLKDEDGAVTVDWVVLTAAVVGLAATGGSSILSATNTLAGNVQTEVASTTVDNSN